MRIHRLKFCSIGPYLTPQDLDFDELSAAGVFLFSGPTGAGKSTILDAICLALYNQPVKKRGDSAEAVVSNNTDLNALPPEVELVFSVGELTYHIHRRLTHSAYTSRGKRRLVKRNGTVNLSRVDGDTLIPLANRQDEVAAQILDIVHLSREQFTKVMMLPQGEFAEFLTARSEQRRPILERLFATGRFQQVTDLLKERAAEARKQVQAQLEAQERRQEQVLAHASEVLDWTQPEVPLPFDEAVSQIQHLCTREQETANATIATLSEAAHTLSERQNAIKRDQEAWRLYQNYRERTKAHEAGQQEYASAHSRLQQHRSAMDIWSEVQLRENARKDLAVAQQNSDQARSVVTELFDDPAWLDDAEQTQEQRERLERDKESVAQAVSARTQADTITEQQATLQKNLATTQERLATSEARATELTTELENLEKGLEQLTDQTQQLQQLADTERALRELTPLRASLVRLLAEQDEHHKAMIAEQKVFLEAREKHSALLRRRFAQARLLLAQELVADEPCAVCGSTEHPNPASVSAEDTETALVTTEQLESAQHAEQRAEEELTRATTALHEAERQTLQAAHDFRHRLQQTAAEATDTATIDVAQLQKTEELVGGDVQEYIEQRITDVAEQHQAAQHRQNERTAALARCEQLTIELQRLTEHQATLRQKREAHQATSAALAEQLESCVHITTPWESTYGSVQEARTTIHRQADVISQVQATATALQTAKISAEQAERALADRLAKSDFADVEAVQSARLSAEDLTAIEQRVRTHEQEAAQLEELAKQELCQHGASLAADEAAGEEAESDNGRDRQARWAEEQTRLQQDLAQLQDQMRAHQERVGELNGFARQLAQSIQDLHLLSSEHEEALAAVVHAEHVAAVADGTDNERRISLPIYVLAAKLEKVAIEASRHLLTMTEGRYEIRYDDERRGTAKAGLGLQILDTWSGQERETQTLSGGESFMASLALALGLADVVQQESGGVSMETLFIDEGFGSLDSATLEEVMKTIRSLFDYGRVVGLVSHVEDMKNDIPTQIRIDASTHGSSATIVTG